MSTKKFKDRSKLDRIYCKSVAKSISEILRFSTNENFRKKAFRQFGVFSTKETEKEINKRLKRIIKNSNSNCCSAGFNSKVEEREFTNLQSEHIKEDSSSNSTVNSDSKIVKLTSNIYNSSWLQTSSEKYRKNLEFLKKQKLSCFSQPELSERHIDYPEFRFHSCEIYQNDSQPTDMSSVSSISSLEVMDDRSYWKVRFRESFKENIHNYFKKYKTEKDSSVEKRKARSADELFL